MIRTEKSTQEQITTSSPAQTDNAACSDNHPAVYDAGQADVAVVGAGHAGIEAACLVTPLLGGPARDIWSMKSTRWAVKWAMPQIAVHYKHVC